jgi:hypothetical protein
MDARESDFNCRVVLKALTASTCRVFLDGLFRAKST